MIPPFSRASAVLGGAVLSFVLSSAPAHANGVVNVYNWSDYIDEEILSEFTAETGIKVVYDVFDSNEVLETKLLAGNTGYDVVVPSATFISRQIRAGVFQKLDKSQLPNIGNMWDVVTERTIDYDPDNAYSINYMWGTTGIGFNYAEVKARLGLDEVTSWDTVFDPKMVSRMAGCGVHVLDAPEEMIPAALNYLGYSPSSTNRAELEAAGELLLSIRPYIAKFNSSEYVSALANGDICLAVGWSGDVLQARDRADEAENGIEIGYAAPNEGALMWFDQMAIPVDAQNVGNAHAFLNYIMRPEVMAKASNYVYYANGNLASQPFLEADVIGDTAIYPDEAAYETLYVTNTYDPKTLRIISRIWTKVKSGT